MYINKIWLIHFNFFNYILQVANVPEELKWMLQAMFYERKRKSLVDIVFGIKLEIGISDG